MDEQEIITLIQQRMNSASRNEQQAYRHFLGAQDEGERNIASLESEVSISQRLVLQGLLDEINGTDNQE